MILFETTSIYGVENGDVYWRHGDIKPWSSLFLHSIDDAYQPIVARGVQPNDFGLFVSLADTESVATIPYLVTSYSADGSAIVPSDIVEIDPRQHGTFELARKLQSVDLEELEQFGIAAIAKQLSLRYPFRNK